MYKVLGAESCSGGDTSASGSSSSSQPKSPIEKTFSEFFISNGKQGGRATVLGEGRDTVRNLHSYLGNNLGKAAVLHSASLSSVAGAMPNSACH
jgi:hypothetical protein